MRLSAFILTACVLLLAAAPAGAQIVNRLKVDDPTFQRYAWGRMQQYNPDNLVLADSLYTAGVQQGNYKYKCLALSLEFPVRYALGEYARMDEAALEIKELLAARGDARAFYYNTLHEYCQYLIRIGRASDAMLEARAMQRLADTEHGAIEEEIRKSMVYHRYQEAVINRYESACRDLGLSEEQKDWLLTLLMQEKNKVDEELKAAGGGHI